MLPPATPAGCVVDDVLERWLDQARRGTTTARLLEGGAAVLLLHHLYPRPGTLERVYAGRRSGNCSGDATLIAAAWSDPPDHSDVDVGDLSVATVLDDLASAFAWIDVGFPAGDGRAAATAEAAGAAEPVAIAATRPAGPRPPARPRPRAGASPARGTSWPRPGP